MRLRGRIAGMLRAQSARHISFHTPGHKARGGDITELSYSDNLASPHGVLLRAQEEIASILGAKASFILTDGSTSGVHAMLYALKKAGVKKIALPVYSHRSVFCGCALMGLEIVSIPCAETDKIPRQPQTREIARAVEEADALLLTSPDYYGNLAPLEYASRLCRGERKPFVVDGAHGAHLHFTKDHAGKYADLWVDGVHKSLPAFTQGAVVSARDEEWAKLLEEGVLAFRTSSPSYPIMASVEHAVKFPRNPKIERAAGELKARLGAYPNDDWSKIVLPLGAFAQEAEKALEQAGIYPEFNDGNVLMFYLSPCTKAGELKKLERAIGRIMRDRSDHNGDGIESASVAAYGEQPPTAAVDQNRYARLPLDEAVGKICARSCGIVPPCIPLISAGERISREKAERLARAENTFGLEGGKILVCLGGSSED